MDRLALRASSPSVITVALVDVEGGTLEAVVVGRSKLAREVSRLLDAIPCTVL